jgi:integrase
LAINTLYLLIKVLFDILLDIFDILLDTDFVRTPEYSARELRSRNARAKLPERSRPYFAHIEDGLSLGYRRGKRGSWIARAYDTEHGYRYSPLDKSNDSVESVGMSFDQAEKAATAWYKQLAAVDAGDVASGPYTVTQLMDDYLKDRQSKKRKDLSHTRYTINSHILPKLGHYDVSKLTRRKVETWRDDLITVDSSDPEKLRKKQATANRIFTILKAALNFGYKHRDNRIATRAAWEKISPFRQVDAPKVRYMSVAECKRLIDACPSDFRRLVRAALYTGCRYSEITHLRVNAFNATSNTLHIAESKSGKSRNIALTDEGTLFFSSVADGKADDDLLFTHESGRHKGEAWNHSQQTYWMNDVCKEAKITPAVSFHILRHTYASHLAMNKTPMAVIAAQLGHSDTRMTERHYAHLGQSYVADVVRANLPSFGFESKPTLLQKTA